MLDIKYISYVGYQTYYVGYQIYYVGYQIYRNSEYQCAYKTIDTYVYHQRYIVKLFYNIKKPSVAFIMVFLKEKFHIIG